MQRLKTALQAALDNGFGIEFDVRDYNGKLVISHNIADGLCQDAEEVFQRLKEQGARYCFLISTKADVLSERGAGSSQM